MKVKNIFYKIFYFIHIIINIEIEKSNIITKNGFELLENGKIYSSCEEYEFYGNVDNLKFG